MHKERLDILVTKTGLVSSRQRAKAAIMAGLVFVNDVKIDKVGTLINYDANIKVKINNVGYVSRGGLKLAKAIDEFNIILTNNITADIGASTGGFTDCILKNGATKVFAIDVGYGQLAWSLRTDSRVINMERTNIRYISLNQIGEQLDFISIDVSFISLKKILFTVKNLLKPFGLVVALIKPQFETDSKKITKKGVIKDPNIHIEIIENIFNTSKHLKFSVLGLTYSPIKGPKGNIEYLLYLKNYENIDNINCEYIKQIVLTAHNKLN